MLWNPGKLPDEITIDKLMQKHPSIPRNRHIANIFFKAGYIEAWGRGVEKIKDGFQKAGKPKPLFEELGGGVMITLFKGLLENVSDNVTDKVTDNVTDNVTDRLSKIIKCIEANSTITVMELALILNVSKRTVLRDIEKLKTDNKLARTGSEKGGHWEIVNDD